MTPSLPLVIQRMQEAEARCDEYVAQNMRQAERLEELEQPDDALLRIGAPAVPFLEQVEWMRKRLEKCEEAIFMLLAALDGLMPNYQYLNECKAAAIAALEEK